MGTRTRTAECKYLNGTTAAASLCEQHLGSALSDDVEECNTGRECSVECQDTFEHCQLVRDGNLCHMKDLREKCCKSCQEADISRQ